MTLLERFFSWDDFLAYHPGLAALDKHVKRLTVETGPQLTLPEYFKLCGVPEKKVDELCRHYVGNQKQVRAALVTLARRKHNKPIDEVMAEASETYPAKHYPFRQSALLFQGNDRMPLNDGHGVCSALCKMWLKHGQFSSHYSEWTEEDSLRPPVPDFRDWAEENKERVVAKQQAWKPERDDPSLARRQPHWQIPTTSTVTVYPGPPMTAFIRSQRAERVGIAMKFHWASYQEPANFWKHCVDGMLHFHSGRNYVGLKWGQNGHAHTVAVKESGGVYSFFDPNGGILEFGDSRLLRRWLMEEWPHAKDYSLDGLQLDVFDYTPKRFRQ